MFARRVAPRGGRARAHAPAQAVQGPYLLEVAARELPVRTGGGGGTGGAASPRAARGDLGRRGVHLKLGRHVRGGHGRKRHRVRHAERAASGGGGVARGLKSGDRMQGGGARRAPPAEAGRGRWAAWEGRHACKTAVRRTAYGKSCHQTRQASAGSYRGRSRDGRTQLRPLSAPGAADAGRALGGVRSAAAQRAACAAYTLRSAAPQRSAPQHAPRVFAAQSHHGRCVHLLLCLHSEMKALSVVFGRSAASGWRRVVLQRPRHARPRLRYQRRTRDRRRRRWRGSG